MLDHYDCLDIVEILANRRYDREDAWSIVNELLELDADDCPWVYLSEVYGVEI